MTRDTGEIAVRPALSVNESLTLGKLFAASGYFSDARQEAQAVTKILYGAEFGIQPVSAMMGIHIINGKPALSANLMAAIIKRSGRYDYRVKWQENGCAITFFERAVELGVSAFTQADAKAAGLLTNPTWQKFPRNMYYARAMSNGARWYCPDLFGGAPIYTPEELGAQVDGDTGEVLRLPAMPSNGDAPLPAPAAPEPAPTPTNGHAKRNKTIAGLLKGCGVDVNDRPTVHYIADAMLDLQPGSTGSINDLTDRTAETLIDRLREMTPASMSVVLDAIKARQAPATEAPDAFAETDEERAEREGAAASGTLLAAPQAPAATRH